MKDNGQSLGVEPNAASVTSHAAAISRIACCISVCVVGGKLLKVCRYGEGGGGVTGVQVFTWIPRAEAESCNV